MFNTLIGRLQANPVGISPVALIDRSRAERVKGGEAACEALDREAKSRSSHGRLSGSEGKAMGAEPKAWAPRRNQKKPARSSERTAPPSAEAPRGGAPIACVSLSLQCHTSAAADAGGAGEAREGDGRGRRRHKADACRWHADAMQGYERSECRRRNGGCPMRARAEAAASSPPPERNVALERESETHGERRGFIAAETLPERNQGKRLTSSAFEDDAGDQLGGVCVDEHVLDAVTLCTRRLENG